MQNALPPGPQGIGAWLIRVLTLVAVGVLIVAMLPLFFWVVVIVIGAVLLAMAWGWFQLYKLRKAVEQASSMQQETMNPYTQATRATQSRYETEYDDDVIDMPADTMKEKK